MTVEKVFFQPGDNGALAVYTRAPYENEKVLQKALADAPDVIAGFTTTGVDPAKLVLIQREMPLVVPGAAGTFHIDHFYADTSGIPVLVEVKLIRNTEIRREVVAQMLDYAANAPHSWTPELITAALEKQAGPGGSVDQLLHAHDLDVSSEVFVAQIASNLAAGNVRLMFVSDEIPESLQRIIEFLNGQMTPAEVLGVEVARYVGPQGTMYVPSLVGRTIATMDKKLAAVGGRLWDRDLFLEAANEFCPEKESALIVELLTDLQEAGGEPRWGRGVTPGFGAWYRIGAQDFGLWNLRVPAAPGKAPARIEFRLKELGNALGTDKVDHAKEELRQIVGLEDKVDAGQWLSVHLSEVVDSIASKHLKAAIAVLAEQPRSVSAG